MRHLLIIVIILACSGTLIQAQSLTISGKITDKVSGEKLIGVTCYDSVSHKVFYSNNEGFFSFTTIKKSANLSFSYVGYVPYQQSFSTSITTEIKLEAGLSLGEARVTSAKNRNFTKIDAATIRKLPSLLGEADVMKSLTFQPGVMGGTEGSAGVYVRGSSPDQNLVLWDEAMLYNINHLGGFFSIFNPTLVKDIQFYKSYLPANYGGRASSVISVTTRDGDNHKLRGEAEIGLLNQNLTLEGPIKKDKSSFILSGRYSNLGIYGALASVIAPNDFAAISFYDISGKATFAVGKTGSLGVSFFRGSDSYTTTSNYHQSLLKNRLGWTNAAYSIRYSVPITQKIFGRFIATQTEYKSQMSYYEKQLETNYTSEDIINNRIIDRIAKASIDFFPNHKIDFTVGADIVFHKFLPDYSNSEQNVVVKAKGSLVKSAEIGTYVSAKIDFTPRIKIESSIRSSRLTGTEINYKNLEPRALLSFTSKKKGILQFAYTNAYQYVHSLSSTGSGFNVELWVPATKVVPPLNVNTISMAYKKSFAKGKINYSSEIYSKTLSNLISYQGKRMRI
jgi:CarboxypepD_reg-like domain/TonB-dependent Receptor Plug Domain